MTLIDKILDKLPNITQMTNIQTQGEHPIHGSTTGNNFTVDSVANVWYCFRCKAGGFVLHWPAVMSGRLTCEDANRRENFGVVLEEAAKLVGLEKELQQSYNTVNEEVFYTQSRIREMLVRSHEYYRKNLTNSIYDKIHELWGFDKETADKLGLGYAPDNRRGLIEYLLGHGYTLEEMLKTGLVNCSKSTDRYYFDHFQGRITLPWFDTNKNVSFFIGRLTTRTPVNKHDKQPAKYKKQMVFNKADHPFVDTCIQEPLFGLQSLHDGIEYIVLSEGITDAMTLLMWDIPTISPVTTNFKKKQIPELLDLLMSYQVPVYVCFDSERNNSGLKGMLNTLECFDPDELDAYMILLPRPNDEEKVDINEYYYKHHKTKEDFLQLMQTAHPRDLALRFWKVFKRPNCIECMMNLKHIPTRKVKPYMFEVANCLTYTMVESRKTIERVLTKMIGSGKELSVVRSNKVFLEVDASEKEQRTHSCKRLIETYPDIKKKFCNPKNCYHKSEDFPANMVTADILQYYEKCFEVSFNQLPRGFMDKEHIYDIVFPPSLFNKAVTIQITAAELENTRIFSRRFLEAFQVPFILPGTNKQERANSWFELRNYWFEHLQKPYNNERAGTTEWLEEDFCDYINEWMKKSFILDLSLSGQKLDEYVYIDVPKNKLFVPVTVVRKYLKDRAFDFKIHQFVYFLKNVFSEPSKNIAVADRSVRMFTLEYNGSTFPEIQLEYSERIDVPQH